MLCLINKCRPGVAFSIANTALRTNDLVGFQLVHGNETNGWVVLAKLAIVSGSKQEVFRSCISHGVVVPR